MLNSLAYGSSTYPDRICSVRIVTAAHPDPWRCLGAIYSATGQPRWCFVTPTIPISPSSISTNLGQGNSGRLVPDMGYLAIGITRRLECERLEGHYRYLGVPSGCSFASSPERTTVDHSRRRCRPVLLGRSSGLSSRTWTASP